MEAVESTTSPSLIKYSYANNVLFIFSSEWALWALLVWKRSDSKFHSFEFISVLLFYFCLSFYCLSGHVCCFWLILLKNVLKSCHFAAASKQHVEAVWRNDYLKLCDDSHETNVMEFPLHSEIKINDSRICVLGDKKIFKLIHIQSERKPDC